MNADHRRASESADPDTAVEYPVQAKTPLAPAAAGWAGALIALALLTAGVIALRDTTIALGWFSGSLWIDAVVDWVDGLRFRTWMIPLALVSLALGAWMVFAAVRPRRRTALPVAARADVWIAPADMARKITTAAETVPGVLAAHSVVSRRSVKVRATVTDSNNAAITDQIRSAVETATQILAQHPKITIRTRTGGR